MKAVFRSSTPYLQVMVSEVMTERDVYSEPGEYYSESGTKVTVHRELVGITFDAVYPPKDKAYIFMEGEKHNLLTLTTLEEIEAMRKFAEGRAIEEVSFEPDTPEEV